MFAIQKYSGICQVDVPQNESESEIVLKSAYMKYQSIFVELYCLKRYCEHGILKNKLYYGIHYLKDSIKWNLSCDSFSWAYLFRNSFSDLASNIRQIDRIESKYNLIFEKFKCFKETTQGILPDDCIGNIGKLFFDISPVDKKDPYMDYLEGNSEYIIVNADKKFQK